MMSAYDVVLTKTIYDKFVPYPEEGQYSEDRVENTPGILGSRKALTRVE